ncbi:MAG: hypothetical protein ACPGVU_09595 [Limisphaerales bacterium]
MRFLPGLLLLIGLIGGFDAAAADAKIVKVLPHLLDAKGRHSLSPSLYERDAYQAHLRKNSELISAMRFDVQWKPRANKGEDLVLKLEVRGGKAGSKPLTLTEKTRGKGLFSSWSKVTISKAQFAAIGGVNAWRVSFWKGDQLVDEQSSFLWSREPVGKRGKKK